jgi:hypothetical protein
MTDDIIRDRMAKVVKELSHCASAVKQREKLLELGFAYFEDEEQDTDIIEEQVAEPQNDRQCHLMAFFNGDEAPSVSILDTYLAEKQSDKTNYPLIRRYFRVSNGQLKKLILFGLECNPSSRELLDDIIFYNEFNLNMRELIALYHRACKEVTDLSLFEKLVLDFYHGTVSHGYDAIYALLMDEGIAEEKQQILARLKFELEKEKEDVRF